MSAPAAMRSALEQLRELLGRVPESVFSLKPTEQGWEAEVEVVERLVLTLVELLRQLMERQALHRVDQGDLTEEQEERLGLTLMLLDDRMTELCDRYGLTLDDLNLDLGPLGPLLPPP